MFEAKYRKIHRTKKSETLKFSFEKAFNEKRELTVHGMEKLICELDPRVEKISCYKFLITGDVELLTYSEELINQMPELRNQTACALPVCFYYENTSGWIYFDAINEISKSIEPTSEEFPSIEAGKLYVMIKSKIPDDLGAAWNADLQISNVEIFDSEELIREKYENGNLEITPFKTLTWDVEFAAIELGELFVCKNYNFDRICTSNRSGTLVLPIKVLGMSNFFSGWIPLTPSRIRYGLGRILTGPK
jgi:hypothetical protein